MPYIIAILVVIALGVGFTLFQSRGEAERSIDQVPTAITTPDEQTTTSTQTNDYKDGTFQTKTTYQTPKRDEYAIDVTLSVANDIVTDAQIVYSQGAEKDPNAQRFEAAYRLEVIGKDIDTLDLSRVGGASLTTSAFNNALANIKTDAKS